jgi:hypothetical protein
LDITIRQGDLAGIYTGQSVTEDHGSSIARRFYGWLARSSGMHAVAFKDPATVRQAAEASCYFHGAI